MHIRRYDPKILAGGSLTHTAPGLGIFFFGREAGKKWLLTLPPRSTSVF